MQFSPTDATKISIDGLYSKFKEDREERWGEVLLRSNEKNIDVVDPVIDSNNNLISATLNNAYVRTEHYLRKSSTEFYQIGGTWDQDLTDTLRFTAHGGFSKSNADIPVETTMVFDDRDANGYHYDYTDMKSPLLTFGTSVTDPSVFQLAEIRDRPSNVTNRFKTGQLRAEWDASDNVTLKAGGMWRRFNFDAVGFTRDTTVCGSSGPDKVLGTLTCSSTVYGFPATDQLSQLFKLGKVPPVMALMFSMAEGTVKRLEAPNDNGWFVVKLDDIEPGKLAPNDPMIAQTMQRLSQSAGQEYGEQFLTAASKEIGVSKNQTAIAEVKKRLVGGN